MRGRKLTLPTRATGALTVLAAVGAVLLAGSAPSQALASTPTPASNPTPSCDLTADTCAVTYSAHAGAPATGYESSFVPYPGLTKVSTQVTGGYGGAGVEINTLTVLTNAGGTGGQGAVVDGAIPVTAGTPLYVEVGGDGANMSVDTPASLDYDPGLYAPTYNGGGAGAGSLLDGSVDIGWLYGYAAGSGGGASDIQTCSDSTSGCSMDSDALLIAGGGGGGGTDAETGYSFAGNGGDAGQPGDGSRGTVEPPSGAPGEGGEGGAAGAAGATGQVENAAESGRAPGAGGAAGTATSSGTGGGGGGGGDADEDGGGGGAAGTAGGGGGGGSGYCYKLFSPSFSCGSGTAGAGGHGGGGNGAAAAGQSRDINGPSSGDDIPVGGGSGGAAEDGGTGGWGPDVLWDSAAPADGGGGGGGGYYGGGGGGAANVNDPGSLINNNGQEYPDVNDGGGGGGGGGGSSYCSPQAVSCSQTGLSPSGSKVQITYTDPVVLTTPTINLTVPPGGSVTMSPRATLPSGDSIVSVSDPAPANSSYGSDQPFWDLDAKDTSLVAYGTDNFEFDDTLYDPTTSFSIPYRVTDAWGNYSDGTINVTIAGTPVSETSLPPAPGTPFVVQLDPDVVYVALCQATQKACSKKNPSNYYFAGDKYVVTGYKNGSKTPDTKLKQSCTACAPNWTITGLKPGAKYRFRLTVTNQFGAGRVSPLSKVEVALGRPKAKVTIPRRGGTYKIGTKLYAKFSCKRGAGAKAITSCVDQSGHHSTDKTDVVDTASLGTHKFTVKATSSPDEVTTTKTISYTVVSR